MFIAKAKITKINADTIQVQTDNNKSPIDISLFYEYGSYYKPKIGDMVKIFKDAGDKTPINRMFAMVYNDKNIQPTLANEGDFAIGNFLKKCYLKFVGKNLETSEDIENIKMQPKTELSLKIGNNEFKITNTGFNIQTTQFNIGAGANFVLTAGAIITSPPGGGQCVITLPGQNIVKI
jgi:hypothetical protein